MVTSELAWLNRMGQAIEALGRQETFEAALRVLRPGGTLSSLGVYSSDLKIPLGAFLAGSFVAEGGVSRQVEPLIRPLRDMFAAIFFVAVGMSIEPSAILEHWPAVLALTAAVLVGKTVGVTSGAFLAGLGTRTSIRAGLSMAQIGEFSFIIAGLGVASGATDSFLAPVAVFVSVVTALLTVPG